MKDSLCILYVAPRYHTNQIPIMKGWNDFGGKVAFLAQYEGIGEIHDYVDYYRMTPSIFFLIYSFFVNIFFDKVKSENLKIKNYIPSLVATLLKIKSINPDIVIIREFTKGNAIVSISCKILGIKKVIMYVQTPLYGANTRENKSRKAFRKFAFPSVAFTPVFYKGDRNIVKSLGDGYDQPKWFVPLVYESKTRRTNKYKGILRIIDIGKYREYKNHYFLVDAVSNLSNKKGIKVTIIGQLSNESEIKYYDELSSYILKKGLSNIIELKGHVPYEKMNDIYNDSDVLVLCSKNETAGMVILEGMAHGLCVVSSINCGLASYLDEYNCGFTYSLENPANLTTILEKIINEPSIANNMGRKAFDTVKTQFNFNAYLKQLNEITRKEYDFELYEN